MRNNFEIDIRELPESDLLPELITKREIYQLLPPNNFKDQLPIDYCLEFDCYTFKDGNRRFIPLNGFYEFVIKAHPLGVLLKFPASEEYQQDRLTARGFYFVYKIRDSIQEKLTRRRTEIKDLMVPLQQLRDGNSTLFPMDFCLWGINQNSNISLSQLRTCFEGLARDEGISINNEKELIHLALLKEAQQYVSNNPSFKVEDGNSLMRMALFDLGPHTGQIDANVKEAIRTRFLDSINKHDELNGQDFTNWLKKWDNIIKQISQRIKGVGIIDRKIVRQVLLELVYEAHLHMAEIIKLALHAFKINLPIPLNADEEKKWKANYETKDYLGGLSMSFVSDRITVFSNLINQLETCEDESHVKQVIMRLLFTHGNLISDRRKYDREYNRLRKLKPQYTEVDFSMVANNQPSDDITFNRIEELREKFKLNCPCGNEKDFSIEDDSIKTANKHISWIDYCDRCHQEIHRELDVAQIKPELNQLDQDQDSDF